MAVNERPAWFEAALDALCLAHNHACVTEPQHRAAAFAALAIAEAAVKAIEHLATVNADRECPQEEMGANIRLIVAAPELLAASKKVLALLDGMKLLEYSVGGGNWKKMELSEIAELRNAIAKAGGGVSDE